MIQEDGEDLISLDWHPPSITGETAHTDKSVTQGDTMSDVVSHEGDESGEDLEEGTKNLNPVEKREAQNNIFSTWYVPKVLLLPLALTSRLRLSKREVKKTKEEVYMALSTADEESLSVRALMEKQDFTKFITDPRDYQLELFERAKIQNTIAVLDTGSGKTLIAVLLLKHVIDIELEDRRQGKPSRIAFFLADCVTLVFQQAAVLDKNLDQKVDRFCGNMDTNFFSRDVWNAITSENMVIVCTPDILIQCIEHAFVTMERINLLIFDEAHHAKGNHPYARYRSIQDLPYVCLFRLGSSKISTSIVSLTYDQEYLV